MGRSFGVWERHLRDVTLVGPLLNRPVQAQHEEIHLQKLTGERKVQLGAFYRDSLEQTRRDHIISPPEPPLIVSWIDDPRTPMLTYLIDRSSSQVYKIDAAELLERATTGPRTACAIREGDQSPPLEPRFESLGEKTIEGLRCEGSIEYMGASCIEEWWSRDYMLTPFRRETNDELEVTCRYFDIKLTEPDPTLFVIPEGFKLTESGPALFAVP